MSQTTGPSPTPSWALLQKELVVFVNKRVESREVAEDIVQDIYLRLHRAEPGSIKNPRAWLYRAARNATIDHYRTRHNDEPIDGKTDMALPDDTDGPNEATQELATCLRPLIAHLPEKYSEAVTLVDLDGITQSQAAKQVGISTSGMKSRVQRGRARLGDLLTNCCAVSTDNRGAIHDYEPSQSCGCNAANAPVVGGGQGAPAPQPKPVG